MNGSTIRLNGKAWLADRQVPWWPELCNEGPPRRNGGPSRVDVPSGVWNALESFYRAELSENFQISPDRLE